MVRSARRPHRNGRKKVTRRKKETWKTPAANPVIRAAWDNKKTLKQNYQALGLAFDSNGTVEEVKTPKPNVLVGEARIVDGKVIMDEPRGQPAVVSAAEPTKTPVIEALEELVSRGISRDMTVSEEEFKMLTALRKKYGTDVERMARDMRRNPYQHTAAQLTRLFKFYDKDAERMTARLTELGVEL
eukprot:Amastigsp_a509744_1201.p2 type:complete len:186 gc:universal Amastigsp_a509744_1201:48-605(+)